MVYVLELLRAEFHVSIALIILQIAEGEEARNLRLFF